MIPHSDLIASGQPIEVRVPDPGHDAIDDVVPGMVVEPRTPEAVAATLAWAAGHGLVVVLRGSGTKIGWGRRPGRVDVLLSTRRLNSVLAHRAGDLTVSLEAGVTLGELNQALAPHGQRLPLDPPFADRATIGGLLATNDSGPLRHRFGTPRDLVIGIRLATVDGRLAKAGGQVVKNVAGYDLAKLVSGSFGSLAAIVSATFKLSPVPNASATIVVEGLDPVGLSSLAAAITSSQLEPVALECHVVRGEPGGHAAPVCLMRFASLAAAVESQVARAREIAGACRAPVRVLRDTDERDLWDAHATRLWSAPGAIVRVSWLPDDLARVVAIVERLAAEMIGRIGIGSGILRLDGDAARQGAIVEELRRSEVLGNVTVIRATPALKSIVSVWDALPNARLVESVKRALDPGDVLGAGRQPG